MGCCPGGGCRIDGIHFGPLRYVALGVGLVAAALVFVPRRFAVVPVVLVAAYFVLASAIVENGRHGIRQASAGGLFAGIHLAHPDWIDRRVGRNADVSFVWHYAGETRPLWNNEFFNRSVHAVYTVDGPDPADGGLPETPVHELDDGRLATATGATPRVRYAVSYTDIAGTRLARDPGIGLALYRVDGPIVILTRVQGVYANDTWSGRRVTYRRLRCTGGQLSVRLGTDSHLFAGKQVVTATEAGHVVASIEIGPTDLPTLGVALDPDSNNVCTVSFTMSTLRVPAAVQPGSSDRRKLGAHFFSFDFSG